MQPPPKSIRPERLFRLLLRLPRPRLPLEFRFNQSSEPIYAQAVSGAELEELATSEAYEYQTLSKVLVDVNDRPLFTSTQLQECLTPEEFRRLRNQARLALDIISPTLLSADWKAWQDYLMEGAKHPSNFLQATALGGCYSTVSIGESIRIIRTPERFFGVPLSQLIDSHWLVYMTCRNLTEEENVTRNQQT